MVHCDPAPPHPPPGEIYNVICPPPGGWLVAIAVLLMLMAVILVYLQTVTPSRGDSA